MKLSFHSVWGIQQRKVILPCLLLLGLVFWAFFPALKGAFIHYDDSSYVIENTHIQNSTVNLIWALTHWEVANWHPLTMWSLMLDHQVYGLNPWGYHLTNIVLHAANTVLLFLVLRRMTGATRRSLMVAALFGLHPLRVESVAWISERKDVLSVLFWMLTLWVWARFVEKDSVQKSKVFYGLALLFFTLGLMSKPMVVTLPFVLLLLDYWPLARWKQLGWGRLAIEKIPFFFLSAIFCVVTYAAQKNGGMMKELASVSAPLSWIARLDNALVAYARYLGKLFWPENLCAYYPHPGHWPAKQIVFASLLLLGLSVFAWVWRRRLPYCLTGWFWFLGTLVPVIGLVQVGSQSMADRYSYIPSIGIMIVLVWGMHQMTKGWHYQSTLLGIVGGGLVLACLVLTRQQTIYWQDEISLWRRAVAVTENNYDAHCRLGEALLSPEHVDEAIGEFQSALQGRPNYFEAYSCLGRAYESKGQPDVAMLYYQRGLDIQPNSAVAHNNLGELLYRNGRMEESIAHYQKALAIEPNNVMALNSLGIIFVGEDANLSSIITLKRATAVV